MFMLVVVCVVFFFLVVVLVLKLDKLLLMVFLNGVGFFSFSVFRRMLDVCLVLNLGLFDILGVDLINVVIVFCVLRLVLFFKILKLLWEIRCKILFLEFLLGILIFVFDFFIDVEFL